MSEIAWTIEPHGDGLVLYEGRTDERHGLNLVYLKEPAHQWPRVKPLIEAAPEMLALLERAVGPYRKLPPHSRPSWFNDAVATIAKATTHQHQERGER